MFCNNWFVTPNRPRQFENEEEPYKDIPSSFLLLRDKIQEFIDNEDISKDNTTAETVGAHSVSLDLNYSAWQVAFKRELSIYKRVKFL